jgi:hypothetical protein
MKFGQKIITESKQSGFRVVGYQVVSGRAIIIIICRFTFFQWPWKKSIYDLFLICSRCFTYFSQFFHRSNQKTKNMKYLPLLFLRGKYLPF